MAPFIRRGNCHLEFLSISYLTCFFLLLFHIISPGRSASLGHSRTIKPCTLGLEKHFLVGFMHCSNHSSLLHHHHHRSPSLTPRSSTFHLVFSLCRSSDSQSIPRSLSGPRWSSVGQVPSPSDFSLFFHLFSESLLGRIYSLPSPLTQLGTSRLTH